MIYLEGMFERRWGREDDGTMSRSRVHSRRNQHSLKPSSALRGYKGESGRDEVKQIRMRVIGSGSPKKRWTGAVLGAQG